MLNIARNPAATWPTVQRAYNNGTSASTGSLELPFQDACDADDYLKKRVDRFDSDHGTAAGTVRVQSGTFHAGESAGVAAFVPDANMIATQNATGAACEFPLDLPNGVTLTGVTMYLKGAAGHAAFPGGAPTMPTIDVQSVTVSTGAVAAVSGTITDGSATAGAYEAYHAVSATGLTEVVNNATKRLYVRLGGEAGANYIVALKVAGVACTYTPV